VQLSQPTNNCNTGCRTFAEHVASAPKRKCPTLAMHRQSTPLATGSMGLRRCGIQTSKPTPRPSENRWRATGGPSIRDGLARWWRSSSLSPSRVPAWVAFLSHATNHLLWRQYEFQSHSGAVDGFSWMISSFAGLKSNASVSVPVVPVIAASKWANRSSILPLSNAFRRTLAR
jgi:hypothetical protein